MENSIYQATMVARPTVRTLLWHPRSRRVSGLMPMAIAAPGLSLHLRLLPTVRRCYLADGRHDYPTSLRSDWAGKTTALYFLGASRLIKMRVMPFRREIRLDAVDHVDGAMPSWRCPFRVTMKGWGAELSLQSAFAKDGSGKGGGSEQGRRSRARAAATGMGTAKAAETAKVAEKAKARREIAAGATTDVGQHVNPSTGDLVQVSGNNIDVLHRNGMREGSRPGATA